MAMNKAQCLAGMILIVRVIGVMSAVIILLPVCFIIGGINKCIGLVEAASKELTND